MKSVPLEGPPDRKLYSFGNWNHFRSTEQKFLAFILLGAIKVKCSEVFRKMLSSRALFCVALAVIACASVGEHSLHDVVVPHLAAAAGYVPGVYGASA